MTDIKDHEVIDFVLTRLSNEYPVPPVPSEAVDEQVAFFRDKDLYPLSEAEWATVTKFVMSRIKTTMGPGTTLPGPAFKNWLKERHEEINWTRWTAYRQFLKNSKGYTPNVVAALDESTNEILNCMGDPLTDGSWKRRGLVIGDVQSGKTGTYLGAINKAADAGYSLIILLAGGTEALRKQTQFRVDEGFCGRHSSGGEFPAGAAANQIFGAGLFHGNNFVSAQPMTTQASDFRKSSKQATGHVIDPNSPTPLVFVVKKNKVALENLRDWLRSQQLDDAKLDVPMLLVDDESDYASINTRDEDSPTLINERIREILQTTTKSSYLAFTATPFANIFIDHETEDDALGDDLFPHDYIRTLDAPTNYVGSHTYFGTEDQTDDSKLVTLDDAEEQFPFKHKSHQVVSALPESLNEALRAFVVASAIREVRGDSSARSMLVNVSRFKNVQAQVHELVEARFQDIVNAIGLHSANLLGVEEHEELVALADVFTKRFPEAPETWSEVRSKLKSAVFNTQVRLINSDRVKLAKSMQEIESDRMIAVGGDVLSRGLTLEGLTVSYFHRSVGASDTLLQMARWFGYRPGYDDLCRVWIPDEVADQFRYVAGIVAELKAQLRQMRNQGLTPRDFGLRVRLHPESLLITARNKMRAAETKTWTINIAGAAGVETKRIDADPPKIKSNQAALKAFVADIEESYPAKDWRGPSKVTFPAVSGVHKSLIAKFLENYTPFPDDIYFADSVLSSFISSTSAPGLQEWLVGFVTGSGESHELSPKLTITKAVKRAVKAGAPLEIDSLEQPAIPFRISGDKSRLAGGDDMGRAAATDGTPLKEPAVYGVLTQPVLLIYVVEPAEVDDGSKGATDARALWDSATESGAEYLVGLKVGIPGKPGDKAGDVKYALNGPAIRNWRGGNIEESDPDDEPQLDGADDD